MFLQTYLFDKIFELSNFGRPCCVGGDFIITANILLLFGDRLPYVRVYIYLCTSIVSILRVYCNVCHTSHGIYTVLLHLASFGLAHPF